MRNIAVIGLLVSACGGESFSNELFVEPGQEAGPGEAGQETGPVVPGEAAPVGEDAPTCSGEQFLRLGGGSAYFASVSALPPLSIELDVRLASDGRLEAACNGPENPCGWRISLVSTQVQATVTAVYDHYVQASLVGSWHHVEWRDDGTESSVRVDGAEAGRKWSAGPRYLDCSGQSVITGTADVRNVRVNGSEHAYLGMTGGARVESECL
jgi:hypothetical protein